MAATERDLDSVWRASERVLGTIHPRDHDADSDRYGEGPAAGRLEARVAELLGKEAAVWLPSGTMAQQIALRMGRPTNSRFEPARMVAPITVLSHHQA